MQTVILAGGFGTRLAELTANLPKPMVEIGGKPMLWHIMNLYASYGYRDFVLALGYRAEVIKQYFLDFYEINNDLTIDLATGRTEIHRGELPDWKVHLVDTGFATETGGRIKRLKERLSQETFFMTYGDGLSNVNLQELAAFHKSHGKLATVTAVRPSARFGGLVLDEERVVEFSEKNQMKEGWINGGFFVLEPGIFDYIEGDGAAWEKAPLENLAKDGELMAFYHEGFWQPMDTLREQRHLEALWRQNAAPWKRWKEPLDLLA